MIDHVCIEERRESIALTGSLPSEALTGLASDCFAFLACPLRSFLFDLILMECGFSIASGLTGLDDSVLG